MCSAATSATIDILSDKRIQENVIESGKYIKMVVNIQCIKEIRQYGLMIGMNLIMI